MVLIVALGQQYNVGEKPTFILYTYIINRHAGTPDKKQKQNRNNVSSTNIHESNNVLFHRLQRQGLYMVFNRVPRW